MVLERGRPSYVYQPLKNKDHIRVLELLPREADDSTLRCRLHQTTIRASNHQYTAISYVWGKDVPEERVTISCDNQNLSITPTLHSALIRAQSLGIGPLFWADAVCINQSMDPEPLKERSHQVRIMDRIYSSANLVLVDLGDLEEQDEDVLEVLDRVMSISQDVWANIINEGRGADATKYFSMLEPFSLPLIDSPVLTRVVQFLCRPWFRRIWIVQEYCKARALRFMIGKRLREDDFLLHGVLLTVQYVQKLWMSRMLDGPNIDRISTANGGFLGEKVDMALYTLELCRRSSTSRPSFQNLLNIAIKIFYATDDRDKVYAILGLIDDEQLKEVMYIDYSEPIESLARRVSRSLIAHGCIPFAFYNCIGVRGPDDCPSWALDLRKNVIPDSLAGFLEPNAGVQRYHFHASGALLEMKGILLRENPSQMLLSGSFLDTVISTGPSFFQRDGDLHTANTEQWNDWPERTLDWMLENQHRQSLSEEQFTRDCWQTTIADSLYTGENREFGAFSRLSRFAICERFLANVDVVYRTKRMIARGEDGDTWLCERINERTFDDAKLYARSIRFATGKRLAISRKGTPCLVPEETALGDRLVIFEALDLPMVVRDRGDYSSLVGTCYVHNTMDGQALIDREIWKPIMIKLG